MNWMPGQSYAFELFMIPSIINTFLATCLLVAVIACEIVRAERLDHRSIRQMPLWLLWLGGIGTLYALTPTGLLVFISLNFYTFALGGTPQAVAGVVFGGGAW